MECVRAQKGKKKTITVELDSKVNKEKKDEDLTH